MPGVLSGLVQARSTHDRSDSISIPQRRREPLQDDSSDCPRRVNIRWPGGSKL